MGTFGQYTKLISLFVLSAFLFTASNLTAQEKTAEAPETPIAETTSAAAPKAVSTTGAAAATAPPAAPAAQPPAEKGLQKKLDDFFGEWIVGPMVKVLFFDISFGAFSDPSPSAAKGATISVPLIVLFLLFGGVFCTFRFSFINFRLFRHSIDVVRGKYDDPHDHGEVTHFQALTSALSATIGLGNIAGVAIAISTGGPGAVFWMWVVAVFGMSAKFASCTLAQIYRRIEKEDGDSEHILGGPMVYLSRGVREVMGEGAAPFGKILAAIFAVFAIMGSLGGGNMFQGNQTFALVSDVFMEGDKAYAWLGGLIMAIMVGMVIVGGIKRIGEVTSRMVPTMCIFYVGVCLLIIFSNVTRVPEMFLAIFKGAFSAEAAAWGGIMGVLVQGVKRGAFSNESGLGSAAIAHSAAKTNEPVREGVVAMIGPFIDTIVICTMTALTILITDAHTSETLAGYSNKGVAITATAISTLAPWLKYFLTIAVFVFAYSTMISWSYYGERSSEYLFGKQGIKPFRAVFLIFVFLGPILSLENVITFTDLLILSMAYPNVMGLIILSGKVKEKMNDYVSRLRSGEMKTHKELVAAQSLAEDDKAAPEHGGKDV